MRLLPALAALAVLGMSACHDGTASLVLQFPSEDTFVASGVARLTLYDAADDDQICRALIAGEPPSSEPLASPPELDICDVQEGLEVLPDLDQGLRALHVEVFGDGASPILQGCRVFVLGPDAGPIVVQLSVTEDFAGDRRDSRCATPQERCSGDC